MRLDELFGLTDAPDPVTGVPVTGMTLDSRLVCPGDVYVALPGRTHHGGDFAAEAVGRGAVAVLTDDEGARLAGPLDRPVVVVDEPRAAMAGLAARVHGEPSRAMTMYAVTGTNGKTTTSFLLAAALRGGRPARRCDRHHRLPPGRPSGSRGADHRHHPGVTGAAGPAGPDA